MILGLFIFFIGAGKWYEVGRIMFFCGLISCLAAVGSQHFVLR
jgi:hypothetical protein